MVDVLMKPVLLPGRIKISHLPVCIEHLFHSAKILIVYVYLRHRFIQHNDIFFKLMGTHSYGSIHEMNMNDIAPITAYFHGCIFTQIREFAGFAVSHIAALLFMFRVFLSRGMYSILINTVSPFSDI
jgi:hypothetical protein